MAVVKNPSLGGYSGRIGDLVYRIVKGKVRVSIRPTKYNTSRSAKATRARNDFSASVKLARAVNQIPALKMVWNSSEIKGFSAYHKIIKTNSDLVRDGKLTTKNIITPEGLYIELSSLTIQSNTLEAKFKFPEGSSLKFPAEVFFVFGFQELEKFLSFSGIINEPVSNGEYTVTISLDSRIKTSLRGDPHPFIFMSIVGTIPSKKKIYWSTTVVKQL